MPKGGHNLQSLRASICAKQKEMNSAFDNWKSCIDNLVESKDDTNSNMNMQAVRITEAHALKFYTARRIPIRADDEKLLADLSFSMGASWGKKRASKLFLYLSMHHPGKWRLKDHKGIPCLEPIPNDPDV